jgi:hypothetical protein
VRSGYEPVPVRVRMYVYSKELLGPRAVWADPDVTNAAEWMRVLVERPDVRAAIGRNSGESMGHFSGRPDAGCSWTNSG